MSDFLGRVVAKTLGLGPVLSPRLPSWFEPVRSRAEISFESEAESGAAAETSAAPLVAAAGVHPGSAFRPDEAPARPSWPSAPAPSIAPAPEPPPPSPARADEAWTPATRERPPLPSAEVPAAPAATTTPAAGAPTPAPSPGRPTGRGLPEPIESRRVVETPGPILVPSPRAPVPKAARPAAAAPPPSRARAAASEAPPGAPSETIVQVHVGRIEVRAATVSDPPPRPASAHRPLSLAEYLRSRRGGGRS